VPVPVPVLSLICICLDVVLLAQDQFENIAQHTQHGIDFCDRIGNFLKERSSIENEYAAKLKYVLTSVARFLFVNFVNMYLVLCYKFKSDFRKLIMAAEPWYVTLNFYCICQK